MRTEMLQSDELMRAAEIVLHGGIVVFPTDTVYGVGTLARSEDAVEQIYRAKNRPRHMAIPVMVSQSIQAKQIARLNSKFWVLAQAFWPGPLTIILPKTERLPDIVTAGGETVALRIPDHPIALQLLKLVHFPMAVTSANLSGQPPALTANDALAQLEGRVDAIVDGGRAPGGQASTIVDITQEPMQLLRAGPISEEEIMQVLAAQKNHR